MKRLLIVVDNLDRAAFFARWMEALTTLGVPFHVLCYRRSVAVAMRQLGVEHSVLATGGCLHRKSRRPLSTDCLEAAAGSLERHSEQCSSTGLANAMRFAEPQIRRLLLDRTWTDLWIWNGSQVVERLVHAVCPPSVRRKFFEISNLPGRLFVDSEGVNAKSTLERDPDRVFCKGEADEELFVAWRQNYLQMRRLPPPQAKTASSMQWHRIGDVFASWCGHGIYPSSPRYLHRKWKGKRRSATRRDRLLAMHHRPVGHRQPYLFLPLQVSGDTQLLINSSVDNLRAIDMAAEQAASMQRDLVVKIHPAENNAGPLAAIGRSIHRHRDKTPVWLSDAPTLDLIEGAESVATINSTVGLETLIVDKPLAIYGSAFYRHFRQRPDRLRAYILNYLVPVDYFASQRVETQILESLLDDDR